MQRPNVGDVFFNKYEVINLIGEGAFGSVYRAKDIKLERFVAIKVIHSAQGVMERFAGEIEAIKKLDHPNIVKLYDFDLLPGGIPCLIMEYVNGKELGDILAHSGPFSFERIGEIALQVLDALVETHKLGIVHCDLKPENILLTSVGARTDVVKLIDFGVASILSGDDSARGRSLVGTPQYMAPEQIHRKNIGPWTDIYALGLILIELSTGHFVFDADEPREVLRKQLYDTVVFPEDLARTELGLVISKAVEKDYTLRYQSTQTFYEELKSALQSMRNESQWRESRARIPSVATREHAFSEFFEISDADAYLNAPMPNFVAPSDDVSPTNERRNSWQEEQERGGEFEQSVKKRSTSLKNDCPEVEEIVDLTSLSMSLDDNRQAQGGPLAPKMSRELQSAQGQVAETKSAAYRPPKKGVGGAVIFAFVILIVLVFAGIYGVESGLITLFDNQEDLVGLEQDNAPKPALIQKPRRATVQALGTKMPYVAYISGIRSATKIKAIHTYRVIATPLDAKLYVNGAMVCYQTPCAIYVSGDLSQIRLRLGSADAKQSLKLSDHKDPSAPILISLDAM